MSFVLNTNAASASANVTAKEKAVSFINLYMPKADGGKAKIGAIALYASRANDKALHDWLAGDESRQEKLASLLIVDFKQAGGTVSTLDLPE